MAEYESAVSLSAMDKLLKGGAASEEPDDDGFKLPDEEEKRPGDGWEKDVPSVQKISQMTDDERDAHREERMRNVRKQMVIAQRRLKKVQEMERAELLRLCHWILRQGLRRHAAFVPQKQLADPADLLRQGPLQSLHRQVPVRGRLRW